MSRYSKTPVVAVSNLLLGLPAKRIAGFRAAVSLLVKVAQSDDNELDFHLTTKEALAFLGINRRLTKLALLDAFRRNQPIALVRTDQGTLDVINMLDRLRLKESTGQFYLVVNPTIVPYAKDLKQNFTTFIEQELRRLSSVRSGIMYLLGRRVRNLWSPDARIVTITELASLFGLPDQTASGPVIHEMKNALDEVRRKTSLVISYQPVKDGRAITAVILSAKYEKQAKGKSLPRPQIFRKPTGLPKRRCLV